MVREDLGSIIPKPYFFHICIPKDFRADRVRFRRVFSDRIFLIRGSGRFVRIIPGEDMDLFEIPPGRESEGRAHDPPAALDDPEVRGP